MHEIPIAISLSSILQLKLPNPFDLCSFVFVFFLFPILVQIPIVLLLFFRIFEPLGVECKL